MRKTIAFLFLCCAYLTYGQQPDFTADTIFYEKIDDKNPFALSPNQDIPNGIYTSDSLQIKIKIPDTLAIMETTYNKLPVLNIGMPDAYYKQDNSPALNILDTGEKKDAEVVLVEDLKNLVAENGQNIKAIDFGRELINGEKACWLMITVNTAEGKTFSTLLYYVKHPFNDKLYMLSISTYDPNDYTLQLATFYHYLKTLEWL